MPHVAQWEAEPRACEFEVTSRAQKISPSISPSMKCSVVLFHLVSPVRPRPFIQNSVVNELRVRSRQPLNSWHNEPSSFALSAVKQKIVTSEVCC
uniref:Uncharacterized protein n=1 Tax=Anguilla anguilla TaxID=7936 RepID=A0A0E9XWA8_ANGAN